MKMMLANKSSGEDTENEGDSNADEANNKIVVPDTDDYYYYYYYYFFISAWSHKIQ